ncbi:MAG: SAM-dependent methyltransferase [Selenomonadaceae bacterium]|nr:SAM-dependent methyltransferase [Selenomonadaceae bacterium]
MQLDARLQAVADFVEPGSRVADVGTDHAYLSVALVESGKARFVIATDKNPGPCEAARRSLRALGHSDRIEVRLGDGLLTLVPGEADTLCLAGMGGSLMERILVARPEVVAAAKMLILQPQSAAADLRAWLYGQAWHIADENLALADGRLYEIIKALPGSRPCPSPLMLAIGPKLWEKKPPYLKEHIEALIFQARRVAAGMERSRSAKESSRYLAVKERISELEAKLKW